MSGVLRMIGLGRFFADLDFVNMCRKVDFGVTSLKKVNPVQLGRGHPEIALIVDPHGVNPRQTLVGKNFRYAPVRRYLQYAHALDVTQVDISRCIHCRPAG